MDIETKLDSNETPSVEREGLAATPCSASSDTPLTDEISREIGRIAAKWKFGDLDARRFGELAQSELNRFKMIERENAILLKERDEARRIAGAYRRVWELCAAAVDETPNHDPLPWNPIMPNDEAMPDGPKKAPQTL